MNSKKTVTEDFGASHCSFCSMEFRIVDKDGVVFSMYEENVAIRDSIDDLKNASKLANSATEYLNNWLIKKQNTVSKESVTSQCSQENQLCRGDHDK